MNEDDTAGDLRTDTYRHGEVPVLSVEGDVDLATAPTLRAAIESFIPGLSIPPVTGGGSPTVAIDLRQVDFIDSAGLALLVEVRKRFIDAYRLALIVERGTQPERVLKLGRFDTFFPVLYAPEELETAAR